MPIFYDCAKYLKRRYEHLPMPKTLPQIIFPKETVPLVVMACAFKLLASNSHQERLCQFLEDSFIYKFIKSPLFRAL